MSAFLILCLAAFLAGLIDAIVGGGGLISLPALFTVYPEQIPATLLGTNKFNGIWGTATAAVNYSKAVKINWNVAIPASITAFTFSFFGAYTITHVSAHFLRLGLPFILLGLAVYTFKRKNFGHAHIPVFSGTKERYAAFLTGGVIGFYDGFFGPGTGSFLVFIFVRYFGFNFLSASAVSKVVNVACNVSALLLFGFSGHIIWKVGISMAIFNIAGSVCGSRLAIKNGSGFVRKLFLFIVKLLIIKTFYDGYLR